MKKKIALFASGSGSNAENIIRYFSNDDRFSFPVILSNKVTALVHDRARRLGVTSVCFTADEWKHGERILECLRDFQVDYIVLAGFLAKIPDNIIHAFPDRIINIHPSLLPKYGGKGMYGDKVHQAVALAGETETGITIHYINEHYDEGHVIFQQSCSVTPDDSPESIAVKVHELEYEFYPKIIEQLWA